MHHNDIDRAFPVLKKTMQKELRTMKMKKQRHEKKSEKRAKKKAEARKKRHQQDCRRQRYGW